MDTLTTKKGPVPSRVVIAIGNSANLTRTHAHPVLWSRPHSESSRNVVGGRTLQLEVPSQLLGTRLFPAMMDELEFGEHRYSNQQ